MRQGQQRRLEGTIFSDLGAAASFMELDWVRRALEQSLGFTPYPATLNLRPKGDEDAAVWEWLRGQKNGIALPSPKPGFCSARLLRVEISGTALGSNLTVPGAVLVPEVENYPKDKIEVVAPMRLKDHFGVDDGDQLTVEFIN